MTIVDILSIFAPTIAIIVGNISIYNMLKASTNETKAMVKEWRKEHREDMQRRDDEVSAALQAIAGFTIKVQNLENNKQ